MEKKGKEDDHYKPTKIKVGGGKTADVYLAFDNINSPNNELVVFKSIYKSKVTEYCKNKISYELNDLVKKIDHENIVSLRSYKESPNRFYIILEYCNGGDLSNYSKNYIKKNNHPLNELYIQNIIKQIAPAIEYMRSKNIIHRDIKLENILINFDNHPNFFSGDNVPSKYKFEDTSLNQNFTIKLADAGYFEKLIKKDKDSTDSTILGIPIYMQSDITGKDINKETDNKVYNTSIDLYSLGAITYELLTGFSPIMGKTIEEIHQNMHKGEYTLPQKLNCSIEIISFINGLLQYYPEKRLNWEQIKEHPFLKKDPKNFKYIELEMISENEKDQIEINAKEADNLLWIFFKCPKLNMNIDKINQMEVKKPEVKKNLKQNIIINNEIIKASEEKENERKKENKKIEEMKTNAVKKREKYELEKNNKQKEQEELINIENEINNLKKDLILKIGSQESSNSKEDEEKLDDLELKLEKNKSDKESKAKELEDIEQQILENEKIINFTDKIIIKNNIEDTKNEIEKLNKEKKDIKKEIKKLNEENKINKINEKKLEEINNKINEKQTELNLFIEQKKKSYEKKELDDWEDLGDKKMELDIDDNNDPSDMIDIDFKDYRSINAYNIDPNYIDRRFEEKN